ncbi:MAG TPA: NAD-dependent malic enzyme [Chlamydiales bacterium]|nr:NAD-dependent malic enzyme [Chlamydiales bacterium]
MAQKLTPEVILNTPLINKGTAFTHPERDKFGLHGFLPPHIETVELQMKRTYVNFEKQPAPLEKYIFLMNLLNHNEILFYQFVARHATEMLPIIYTPTVGDGAIHHSNIFAERRGLYLSFPLAHKMDEILANYPYDDVQVIVVTDGERILGLGDQGLGGMTIPIGKLILYSLFGGIHPAKTLPIMLDVGTNNEDRLNNELYLGWRHPRLTGDQYDQFIDQFVKTIKKRFPKVLLQWEDFGKNNATRILDKYKSKLLSFNDDIQGTAAVTLGALLAAVRSVKEKLSDQCFVILGGGSAGSGIANLLVLAMEEEGLSKVQARKRIYILDSQGLVNVNSPRISPLLKDYVRKDLKGERVDLMTTVMHAKPSVLIGVSGQSGVFTREIIQMMYKNTKMPIVFPLSNPTSKTEVNPQDIIEWTNGNSIVATGSPFPPVTYGGKIYKVGQCNNVYIFPGVGAGVIAVDAKEVTDTMFLEAARILAGFSPRIKDPNASLFPDFSEVKKICREIAIGVGKKAIEEGLSKVSIKQVEKRVDALMWTPHYSELLKKNTF